MLVRRAAVAAVSLALALTGCQFSGGTAQVTNDGVCTEIELPAVDLAAAPTAETQLPGPILRPCPTTEPTTTPPTTSEPPPPTTTEPPPAVSTVPQNLTGTADQAARTISLDWDDVADATEYRIYGRWWQGGVLMDGGDHLVTTVTESNRTSGQLADDATYDYWVTAVVDGVESGPSAEVRVVLGDDTPPGGTTEPTTPPTTDPAPGPGGIVPVGATELFVGDYDTGDFSQWGSVQKEGYNGSADGFGGDDGLQIVNAGPGHETAARFKVGPGDEPEFGGERSEVRNGSGDDDPSATRAGDERWYELQLLFPNDFPSPANTWFIVMQWHAGSGSPPLALEVGSNDQLRLTNNRTGDHTDLGPITRGAWMDVVLHVEFSSGSDGLAEAWINGVKAANAHQGQNAVSGTGHYIKMGVYRGDQSATHVVLHDGLRITAP